MDNIQSNVLKVQVVEQKREQVIKKREIVNMMITLYYNNGEHDAEELRPVRSSLISLFMEIGEHIKRYYSAEEYDNMKTQIYFGKKMADFEDAYQKMDGIIFDVIDTDREPLL